MGDIYATIEQADRDAVSRLADVLELRAADPQQRAMLEDYLADLELREGARVLEIGCGPGPISRTLASIPNVREVVGIDPSPVFIDHARAAASEISNVSFVCADGRALPFDDGSFDAVICHTSLCHIPQPADVLAEAQRVTFPSGLLAVFDGDYATTTVAITDHDPLQACRRRGHGGTRPRPPPVRHLPTLTRAAGYQTLRLRSHSYTETTQPNYMLTIVDRGAAALVADGYLSTDAAEALTAEAR